MNYEIRVGDLNLDECGFKLDSTYNSGNYALFTSAEVNSFKAIALEFVSCDANSEWNDFSDPNSYVEIIFLATAYFDGVRHLEFNRLGGDMDGHIYYPDMDGIIHLLSRVREIELEKCRDCNKRDGE